MSDDDYAGATDDDDAPAADDDHAATHHDDHAAADDDNAATYDGTGTDDHGRRRPADRRPTFAACDQPAADAARDHCPAAA